MKKYMYLVITSLILLIISACGTEPNLPTSTKTEVSQGDELGAGSTLDQIVEKGEITIAVDDTFPPMNYRNEQNELVGFDVDLAKAVAGELGVEARFIPTAWDGILPGLDAKRYDIIMSSMSITDERKKQVDFVEYVSLGQVIAVESGNPLNIQSIDDLEGKIVGVQIGSSSEVAAREMEVIKEIKTYNAYTDAFNDLGLGRLEAIVVSVSVGRYYETTKPGIFEVTGESFNDLPVGIAIRKEDDKLEKALQDAMTTLKDNGEFARISEEWFGTDISNQ